MWHSGPGITSFCRPKYAARESFIRITFGRRVGGALSGVSSQMQTSHAHVLSGLAVLGVVLAVTACSSSGTPAGSSTSRPGVVTTLPGGETCKGRVSPNVESPDFYRQHYANDLASPLKERLKTYDSAVVSGDTQRIGQAADVLGTEIRADAKLVDSPRVYGCYDQQALTHLQNAAVSFADALDAMSCASADMCGKKQTEVPGIVAQAAPQERAALDAFNAYAAQFGGEKLPLPPTSAGPRGWRL